MKMFSDIWDCRSCCRGLWDVTPCHWENEFWSLSLFIFKGEKWNIGNHSPSDTVSHPRRLESTKYISTNKMSCNHVWREILCSTAVAISCHKAPVPLIFCFEHICTALYSAQRLMQSWSQVSCVRICTNLFVLLLHSIAMLICTLRSLRWTFSTVSVTFRYEMTHWL